MKVLELFCDRCGGQNNNHMVLLCCCMFWITTKFILELSDASGQSQN